MKNKVRLKSAVFWACLLLALALLLSLAFPALCSRRPVQYAAIHPASTVPPLWGFSADSVFNVGTAEEINAFPGIGEVYAQRIVEGRDILGNYRLPEDLMLVKGIGEKRLAAMMEALTEPLVVLEPLDQ